VRRRRSELLGSASWPLRITSRGVREACRTLPADRNLAASLQEPFNATDLLCSPGTLATECWLRLPSSRSRARRDRPSPRSSTVRDSRRWPFGYGPRRGFPASGHSGRGGTGPAHSLADFWGATTRQRVNLGLRRPGLRSSCARPRRVARALIRQRAFWNCSDKACLTGRTLHPRVLALDGSYVGAVRRSSAFTSNGHCMRLRRFVIRLSSLAQRRRTELHFRCCAFSVRAVTRHDRRP